MAATAVAELLTTATTDPVPEQKANNSNPTDSEGTAPTSLQLCACRAREAFTVTELHPECHSHGFLRIFCYIYSIIRRIIAAKPMPVSPSSLVVSRRRWTCWPFKKAAQRRTSKN